MGARRKVDGFWDDPNFWWNIYKKKYNTIESTDEIFAIDFLKRDGYIDQATYTKLKQMWDSRENEMRSLVATILQEKWLEIKNKEQL